MWTVVTVRAAMHCTCYSALMTLDDDAVADHTVHCTCQNLSEQGPVHFAEKLPSADGGSAHHTVDYACRGHAQGTVDAVAHYVVDDACQNYLQATGEVAYHDTSELDLFLLDDL